MCFALPRNRSVTWTAQDDEINTEAVCYMAGTDSYIQPVSQSVNQPINQLELVDDAMFETRTSLCMAKGFLRTLRRQPPA